MTELLVRARSLLEQMSGVLITSPTDLFYLTGVHLSQGTMLLTKDECSLFIDMRYQVSSPEINVFTSSQAFEVQTYLSAALQRQTGSLLFDSTTMTVDVYQRLSSFATLQPAPQFFQKLRRQKFPHEIDAIHKACQLCENGFSFIIEHLREGVTEKELSSALKCFWFSHGADSVFFEPIIAFGKHSSCPHWHPSSTPLLRGDIVLIDIGVCLCNYNSDMTRVVFFGKPDEELLSCHTIVKEAYERAFAAAVPEAFPHAIDTVARSYIASKGYEKAFLHGLGHGVGLKIHEAPRLSPSALEEHPLAFGDVITIEPGIYIPGRGGIRLENTIVIEEVPRSLFSLSLEPLFL